MQVFRNTLLCDFTWFLDLELLLQSQSSFRLRNSDDRTLHEGIHHPVLDRLGAAGRAGVEEEHGALFGSVMRVLVAVEGEARFAR